MIRDEDVIRVARARGQYAPDPHPRRFLLLFDAARSRPPGDLGRRPGSTRCAVSVPLPSDPAPKPWLYTPPEDAADYLAQLDDLIAEELERGAVTTARQERLDGDIRLLTLAPYGFERASEQEHERLLDEVGPHGRYASVLLEEPDAGLEED